MSVLSSDLQTLSYEAYVYLYSLVTMDVTRQQQTNAPADSTPGFGPPNRFHHMRSFPDVDFRAVVRPNFDTLYSSAWLDLTRGPVRVHVPDSGDRFYMLPILDAWTDVFANPGKRTTGTAEQDFVVVGPGYGGELPAGVPVIHSPTPHAWMIGRTQTNGPADYAAVHEFQDGLRITELGDPAPFQPDPALVTEIEPLRQVNAMSATEFFERAATALRVDPPHSTDFSQLARIALLGIVPGRDFDASRFSAADRAAIDAGVTAARAAVLAAPMELAQPVNGWVSVLGTIGVYGNNYFTRSAITLAGLGANPPEDAIYPLLAADADGDPLVGDNDYLIHFDAGKLPPAAAFWSITMYNAEGFQIPNELDRFAIGDRDPLQYNPDGSLDIHVSRKNPGPDREANWLPAPSGPLGITMRLYAPRAEALDGTWAPPPVQRRRD
ncbi:DUF1254 domain-containing protein [Nocardia sp. NPDC050718]|uniref:DUF1254 domain-containing protein n=1 Tax=Nocardia sp. NPDC050718 TaxID=3155788 RepID=UPI0033EEBD1B